MRRLLAERHLDERSARDLILHARINLREEEEQDEEDGDDACEEHPATPAVPGAVAIVAITAMRIMSAPKSSAYRMTSACADLLGTSVRNELTGCSNHNTGGVRDSSLRVSRDTCLRASRSDG